LLSKSNSVLNTCFLSRVSFGGHSAGAHLAIAMLTQTFLTNAADNAQFLNSIFLISGCYDLQDLRFTEAVNKNNILSLTDNNVQQLSPVYHSFDHLQSLAIQFIVYVAENDSATFKKQSQNIFEKLNESNLKVDYKLLPELDHFDIVENLSLDDYEITKNIISNLKS
jgi:arylformamidase